ncbi:putative acetyltransferase [Isoptericola jiangsuensis]|uniref:Putative acetyltransferase n=1 Tax=Isoptericola jiangsuensis TaxID=548579 RepID=A0A2A9F2X7_9MICO|nr:GNAT family N-acetyltransferase [Isoptericola jiangsuensis]PFG44805.1 putative acetyltransferase [Isoptericola jiangsuensis]
MTLILRPPTVADEPVLRRLHAELATEDFPFLLADGPWDEMLATWGREAAGVDLPPGRVRADFLVADVDGVPVGRVSIRYELNEFLREVGGHVGYAVGREHRGRGHAREVLRQSVERLAGSGVDRVLVTCDDDNLASAAVIEACGGVLEDHRRTDDGILRRRYWIDATRS